MAAAPGALPLVASHTAAVLFPQWLRGQALSHIPISNAMSETADLTTPEVNPEISARTRKALAQARERGVKLGTAGAANIRATVEKRKSAADAFARQHEALFAELQQQGLTHRAMAAELNARGIAAAKGGEWTHGQVQRILNRYADWKAAEPIQA